MVTGIGEIAVVVVIAMVFFGAGMVPKVMGSVGASVKSFREAAREASASDDDKPAT